MYFLNLYSLSSSSSNVSSISCDNVVEYIPTSISLENDLIRNQDASSTLEKLTTNSHPLLLNNSVDLSHATARSETLSITDQALNLRS